MLAGAGRQASTSGATKSGVPTCRVRNLDHDDHNHIAACTLSASLAHGTKGSAAHQPGCVQRPARAEPDLRMQIGVDGTGVVNNMI